MRARLARALVGGESGAVTRHLGYAGALFVLAVLCVPASLAVAGAVNSAAPVVADVIAVGVGGGLFAASLGLATLAAYRRAGYASSLTSSAAVPLAAAVLYVAAGATGRLVADVHLWTVVGYLLGGAVLLGTLAFAVGTSVRAVRPSARSDRPSP